MAVPKTKQSKSRTNKRFANYKATAATLVECPHCHELKIAHRVCKNCGYYDGKEVVAQEEAPLSGREAADLICANRQVPITRP